ncbi:MAG: hypothetical protein FWD70_07360 [Desulfuromonadales bacterium]|nr:hypothetical protein [Desulfuromonadales bacterium]
MRYEAWDIKLMAFIETRANMPFKWGEHDCCLFAADAVLEITGIDYAEKFRGKYADMENATKLIKQNGGNMSEMINGLLETPIKPALAQRGDVVMYETEDGPALGICTGVNAVFAAPTGLNTRPTLDCQYAWRIA